MSRPTRALIDLGAVQHNLRLARRVSPGASTLAVSKADAYGHGALAVARALAGDADAFAVACHDEALALRQAGIHNPFLLLEGFFEPEELHGAAGQGFWLMLENRRQIDLLLTARLPRPVTVWLKVDTGMHRLGLPPAQLAEAYRQLDASPNVAGTITVATHLACADELDNPFTRTQAASLRSLAASFDAPVSIANSPGLLGWPDARGDWNRPGFMLYGNSPFPMPHPQADQLQPAMTICSEVISLRQVATGEGVGYGLDWRAQRPSLIATVPIGYGDGYPRTARNGTPVLVNGQPATLAGRVSMDLITVDVTDIDGVAPGSAVECWGKNLSVNTVAQWSGTSAYELLTRIPARLPRVYV